LRGHVRRSVACEEALPELGGRIDVARLRRDGERVDSLFMATGGIGLSGAAAFGVRFVHAVLRVTIPAQNLSASYSRSKQWIRSDRSDHV
jgi:hypothetical protein